MKKNKIKKVITIVVTLLAAAMVVLSGVMKLLNNEQVVNVLTKVGVIEYISLLPLFYLTSLFFYRRPKNLYRVETKIKQKVK